MRQALMLSAAAAMLMGLVGCACTGSPCGPGCMMGTCYDAPETCAGCACNSCPSSGDGMVGGAMAGGVCDPACGCGSGCGLRGLMPWKRWRAPFNPGPASGAVTYPYYTTRGPRDFLASNPRSIGP